MQKTRKKLVGLVCLALVALMTIVAYFMPTPASATGDSHTDVIRVTVYDQYPSVVITSPETDSIGVSEELEVKFSYENANHVEFVLSYAKVDDEGNPILDEEGNPVYEEITLPQFDPEELDETFFYDSGDGTVTFRLGDYLSTTHADMFGNNYGNFVLTARAVSAIGYDEDSIEFNYSPTTVTQTGSADGTQDPIVEVDYDNGVAKVELMVVDANGNELFTTPVVVTIDPDENGDFVAGSKSVTLPFGSYGINTGDYYIVATSYYRTATQDVDEDDNPVYDEDGNPVYSYDYEVILNQYNPFPVSYTQPAAPDVPDTGRFLETLNIAKSDFIITGVIAFAGVVFIAFALLGRKKKDYRKNIRGRR